MSITAQTIVGLIKKYPVLVVCGVASIAFASIIYARSGVVDQLQEELGSVSKEVNRYSSNISNAAQLQDQLDFLIKANDAVKQRTLSADGLAINLQYFYRLESEVGIKYLDLRPSVRSAQPAPRGASRAPVKRTNYVPLNYTVAVEGSYDQVLTYLRHIEQGTYFGRVNFASASGKAASVTVNLNIDLLGSP